MRKFQSLRRVMGGYMPPEQAAIEVRDEGMAETLRHVEILGRLILRTLQRLEKKMDAQNYTVADILAATKEQQGVAASMSTMLTQIHARVMQLVANQIDPATQASINEAFAEIKGNSRALADAITTYTPDANAGQTQPGTGTGSTGGAAAPSATSTTVSLSKSTINVGDGVTMSAGVSSSNGNVNAVTGSVTFAADGQTIGSANLDSTGVAAFSTTSAPAGDHSITAVYSGDANYAPSTSEAVTLSVMPAAQPATPVPPDPAAQQSAQAPGS